MSDHSITSLIEKLEGAEVGSRELDCAIWTATGGWDHVGRPPTFSTSLDVALALAERVLPGARMMVERFHDGKGWAMVQCAPGSAKIMTDGNTPALALCAAILRAQSEARV